MVCTLYQNIKHVLYFLPNIQLGVLNSTKYKVCSALCTKYTAGVLGSVPNIQCVLCFAKGKHGSACNQKVKTKKQTKQFLCDIIKITLHSLVHG